MSKISSWSAPAPWDVVCRRASGRRHYNSIQKFQAAWRRVQVINLLRKWGFEHGVQARIASELEVSQSTISRDLALLKADFAPCPCCGKWRHNLDSGC